MLAAGQIFNKRENNPITTIYGAVSRGTTWKFLTLENQLLSIDKFEYYINQDRSDFRDIIRAN